jgi:uncharacterized membrane protein YdjX (TVP38/TMEM64 family)
MDLELEMANRVRRHMITSLIGVLVGIALLAGLGNVLASTTHPPILVAVMPLLGIAVIPAIGFWSTYRNLRCPSCNRLVALQVSSNYSIMSAYASKTCNGCGQKIFGDLIARRFRRMMFIAFFGALVLFMSGAIASMVLRPH